MNRRYRSAQIGQLVALGVLGAILLLLLTSCVQQDVYVQADGASVTQLGPATASGDTYNAAGGAQRYMTPEEQWQHDRAQLAAGLGVMFWSLVLVVILAGLFYFVSGMWMGNRQSW